MSILRVRDKDGNIQEILAIRGEQGEQGPKGDAPVRGVDYYTETDKQEIIEDVLENVNIGITEDNFYDLLSEQANDPDSILSSVYANADSVNELEELIVYNYVSWDDIDVDGGVASHEALEDLKHKNETNYWGYLPTNEFDMMLQEKIEDEDSDLNVKYATNNWVEDIVINEIGDKKSIYGIDLNNATIEEGGYYNSELEWVEDANCCVFILDTAVIPELKGKTINIITYMFGEMWTGCSDSPHTIKTNPNASTNQGVNCVFESTFTFSETAECPTWVYIPYYNNIYLEKPIVYELNTTLWQAVKNLNDKHETTEIDSWDYAINNGFYKSSGESPDGTEWFGISSNNKKDNIQIVWKIMDEDTGIYPLIKTRVKKEDTEWGQWHDINGGITQEELEEALYGEDSNIVNNQDLEQILSDYPTFGDVETYLTASVDEGGIKETLVVTVIESEDFNARVSSSFYWELEGIAASEPDSEERRIFAETVLAVLPIYNGEYSVEVI